MVLAGIAGLLLPWESNEGDERTFVTFVSAASRSRTCRFDIVVTGDPIEMASSKRGVSLSMAEVELEFLGEPLILSVTAIVPAEESEGQIAFDLVEVN